MSLGKNTCMTSRTILLTRPQRQSVESAGKLWAQGWKSRIGPLFIIEPLPAVIDDTKYQAILLTSANAAPALKDLKNLPVFTVGDATAEMARQYARGPVESASGDAEALAALIKEKLDPAKGPLLYLAGKDRANDFNAIGFQVDIVEVYAARPVEALSAETLAALRDGSIFATLLYSPAAARQFRAMMERAGADLDALTIICMSSKVAEAAGPGWSAVEIAETPDEQALTIALERCYAAAMKNCASSPKVGQVAFTLAVVALILAGTGPLWAPLVQAKFGLLPRQSAVISAPAVPSLESAKLEEIQKTVTQLSVEIQALKSAPASTAAVDTTPILSRLEALERETSRANQTAADLSGKVEELKAGLSARKENDAAVTARLSATLQLASALQNGEPFSAPLAALHASTDPALLSKLNAAEGALSPYRETGLPTRAKLIAEYAPAVRAALASEASDKGVLAGLSGLVSVRKTGEVNGADAEAIFARAETKLNEGDLKSALEILTALPAPAAESIKPWREKAEARLKAEALAADLAKVEP